MAPTAGTDALAARPCDLRLVVVGGVATVAAAPLLVLGPEPVLPAWWAGAAIAVRLFSGGQYAWSVVRGRARPNVVTWFLWGLTPMIAAAAQLDDGPGPEVAVTFVLGLGPLVVAAVALGTDRSAFRPTRFTALCGTAALVGVVLWQLTENAEVAIVFCIVADLLATLPTLRKAYADPGSEYAPPYLLSVLAMIVTLGTVEHRDVTSCAFPLYMLLVNATLFAFAALPLARMARGRQDVEVRCSSART